jgi:putative transposase
LLGAPQCALLQLSRAAVYSKPKPVSAADLELMRLIDEQYLKTPFYGARKMAVVLSRGGHQVGRKRVMRLAVCCCCCRCKHVAS